MFNQGDYDRLIALASATDWNQVHEDDIDVNALNITNKTFSLAKECIPNNLSQLASWSLLELLQLLSAISEKEKLNFCNAKNKPISSLD